MKAFFVGFWNWVFCANNVYPNLFTFLTVLLSGYISWKISAHFFNRTNRENAKISILLPIKQEICAPLSKNTYVEINRIARGFAAAYLTKEENERLSVLLEKYKNAYYYDYDLRRAQNLAEYFEETLKKHGISTLVNPIYINDEIVDMDVPSEILYLPDNIARVIKNYPPEYELEVCVEKVIAIFNGCCQIIKDCPKIEFFKDKSFSNILKNNNVREEKEKILSELEESKKLFLELSAIQ